MLHVIKLLGFFEATFTNLSVLQNNRRTLEYFQPDNLSLLKFHFYPVLFSSCFFFVSWPIPLLLSFYAVNICLDLPTCLCRVATNLYGIFVQIRKKCLFLKNISVCEKQHSYIHHLITEYLINIEATLSTT